MPPPGSAAEPLAARDPGDRTTFPCRGELDRTLSVSARCAATLKVIVALIDNIVTKESSRSGRNRIATQSTSDSQSTIGTLAKAHNPTLEMRCFYAHHGVS